MWQPRTHLELRVDHLVVELIRVSIPGLKKWMTVTPHNVGHAQPAHLLLQQFEMMPLPVIVPACHVRAGREIGEGGKEHSQQST